MVAVKGLCSLLESSLKSYIGMLEIQPSIINNIQIDGRFLLNII